MQALQKETIRLDGRYCRDFYKLWNSTFNIFAKKTAQKMRMLMKFATDSKLGGSVNPEVGLSNWKKQRILDDETNRHGMKFN